MAPISPRLRRVLEVARRTRLEVAGLRYLRTYDYDERTYDYRDWP